MLHWGIVELYVYMACLRLTSTVQYDQVVVTGAIARAQYDQLSEVRCTDGS